METTAIVMEEPGRLDLKVLTLAAAGDADVVVDVDWTGISTGTERLLWSGTMPAFPGMGYPLVPGYEASGRVVAAGPASGRRVGEHIFVPGASCFGEVRGLFGAAANRLVVNGTRVVPIDASLRERGVLLALAATAHHALADSGGGKPLLPELVVGHGVVGRLVARLAMALGGPPPTVWETDPQRRRSTRDYPVVAPEADMRRDYARIIDASGDAGVLDALVGRLAKGGEIVLAGFYEQRIGFAFVPAFLRELRLRVAAEWNPSDMTAVSSLIADGRLSLDGIVTHVESARHASAAYRTAFTDSCCLKMVLDWRTLA